MDTDNKIVSTSFDIIFNAGEARNECEKALRALEAFDFEEADKCMKEANAAIVKAHAMHTEVLQAYIGEMEGQDYYMIFSHAQDHLMTTNSEIIIAKHLIKLTKAVYEKIK